MSQFNLVDYAGSAENILEENKLGKGNSIVDKNITVSSDSSSQNEQNSPTEMNTDDYINNSDSLSSSASISDLTSTDSEDSLALSESESITDVTPLNSPYCDSPLSQSRLMDHKLEDKSSRNYDNVEIRQGCCPPEVNVLMKAIEKLELEAKKAEQSSVRITPVRRRTVSCGSEDVKRMEQENNRLFKRVISQQSRIRTMYPTSSQPSRKSLSNKQQDLVKSDGDISYSTLLFSLSCH
ncbi:uncharacterized protein NPIL_231131 [Nephila pilipes]|uniref:Uncharacterized protein n=1 Tax=Nephila pilipes TaxID=299642 RepID=A0A8X6QZ03_NEPPI|nr:uncharacterized protein NPIL_231131 [Nephila pilipes]